MAPGRLEPEASTLSLFSSDGLNHAQASELGRLFHLGGAASSFGEVLMSRVL
jgi:hypothetical protein